MSSSPLSGFVVGVTATRRRQELTAALRERGAAVIEAPLLRYVSRDDDNHLHAATKRCVDRAPDYVVVSTGEGWRGWIHAADGWRLATALLEALNGARILARGPKAALPVRAAGLEVAWSPQSEELSETLAWLRAQGISGRHIALVEAGSPHPAFVAQLKEDGAEVICISVYQWAPPVNHTTAQRLTRAVLRREVHAVSFASAPAVSHLLDVVGLNRRAQLLQAFATDVIAAYMGPVCARQLTDNAVPVVWPKQARLEAMVELIEDQLISRFRRTVSLRGEHLVIQGRAVVSDSSTIVLTPACAALLQAFLAHPGGALSRMDLRSLVWPTTRGSLQMVDITVARLRTALGPYAGLVVTANRQGYQLAAEAHTANG